MAAEPPVLPGRDEARRWAEEELAKPEYRAAAPGWLDRAWADIMDWLRSLDGGSTWTRPDASPDTATFPFCSQSQGGVVQAPIAFGGGGLLYMALTGSGNEEAARTGGGALGTTAGKGSELVA